MPKVTQCRICTGTEFRSIFDLGEQPLANNLMEKSGESEVFPLELIQCTHCSLMQLSYVVPKEKMFDTYFYIPSVSQTGLNHFKILANTLCYKLPLKPGSLVVDIGSSDGSFLNCFEELGMDVFGIEPAQNIKTSVPTIHKYFNKETAQEVVDYKGKAKLATATNVFAHIDNLREFIEGLDVLLDDDGVFFAQFPDVRNLLLENQFDTIYHEHLSYFTYAPLHYLFANSPFELSEILSTSIHGGSMQIIVRRRKPLVNNFLMNTYKIKKDLVESVRRLKKEGKKVVGFGAAAKGVVLLNYCGFTAQDISYVVDGTPYKQGKVIPGVNIPVKPEEYLLEDKPDVILILAWNFKEEIIKKLEGRGYTFIIPIPHVEVYEDSHN